MADIISVDIGPLQRFFTRQNSRNAAEVFLTAILPITHVQLNIPDQYSRKYQHET